MQPYEFDGDYVRRLAEGDPTVEDHFGRYFGELLNIKLRARVRTRAMLEDVRQETFVRVLETLRQKQGLEHPERLGAFVHSVCKNVMFEKFRDAARQGPLDADAQDRPDGRINAEDWLISQERKLLVESVLQELSVRDRELLRMVFFEEVSKAEACERLGMGGDHLRVVLHRALTRLRERLAKRKAQLGRPSNQQDSVKRRRLAVHYTVRYSDGT